MVVKEGRGDKKQGDAPLSQQPDDWIWVPKKDTSILKLELDFEQADNPGDWGDIILIAKFENANVKNIYSKLQRDSPKIV